MKSKKDKDINKILSQIFKKIFKLKRVNSNKLNYESVPNWDSLAHMQLVSQIEKKFRININEIDISTITSYNKIIKLLKKKYE
jgi:acyl carrier protein